MMFRRMLLAALLLASAGCGYYNSLYNAERRFAAAERAERDGNRFAALSAYKEAIDRAFVSYDRYPESRWADDALLLIARARFARDETMAAEAALRRVLEKTTDGNVRRVAHAYLGASRVRLGQPNALAPLDSAVALADDAGLEAFSRLWRARARFAAGDTAGAWDDLAEAARRAPAGIDADVRVEALTRAVTARDSLRWRDALQPLLSERTPVAWNDSVRKLLRTSAANWGPAFVSAAIPASAGASLAEEQRLRLRLLRAELLAAAGDTTTAVDAALDVASSSILEPSSLARVRAARWLLAGATEPADLARIRSVLLPAFSHPEGLPLIRAVRTADVLLDRAADEPVAVFTAAEFARDVLRAPVLARNLFLRFHGTPGAEVWRGKALLAALDLSQTGESRAEVRALLDRQENDLYVMAVRGATDTAAYSVAETRLHRQGSLLLGEARALAASGDVSVSRAVAVRDSVRLVLLQDSLRTHCTAFIDSVAVKGVRADSTRVACMRADTARVRVVLTMDTLLLRPRTDTVFGGLRPDSVIQE